VSCSMSVVCDVRSEGWTVDTGQEMAFGNCECRVQRDEQEHSHHSSEHSAQRL
jgi:hypothetical protein